MTRKHELEELRRRYGVSVEFAERLRPLLEKAAIASPDVRERLLALVQASFEREAQRRALERVRDSALAAATDRAAVARAEAEERVLRTVAAVLHGWSTSRAERDGAQGGTQDD